MWTVMTRRPKQFLAAMACMFAIGFGLPNAASAEPEADLLGFGDQAAVDEARLAGTVGGTELNFGDVGINLSNNTAQLYGNSVEGTVNTGQITDNTLNDVRGFNSLMYNTGNNVNFLNSMQVNVFLK